MVSGGLHWASMFQLRDGRSKLKPPRRSICLEGIRTKNKERRFPNRRLYKSAVGKSPLLGSIVEQAFLPAALSSQGKRERLPYNC